MRYQLFVKLLSLKASHVTRYRRATIRARFDHELGTFVGTSAFFKGPTMKITSAD
jgi:hypothetical protein